MQLPDRFPLENRPHSKSTILLRELDELADLQKEGVRFAIQKFPALIAGKRTPPRALEE